jgi:chromate transporter
VNRAERAAHLNCQGTPRGANSARFTRVACGPAVVNVPVQRISVPAIFLVFFRIGLFSFGGGLSGWVYRDVVVLRGWLTEDEFLSGMAVSQILPGANIANLAVYIGQKLIGPVGVAAALLGLFSGPFFAVIALASGYHIVKTLPFADAALDGVAAAAIGLLLMVVAKSAQRAARHLATLAAFVATFVAVAVLHWPLLMVVVVVGSLSVWAAWMRHRADA